MATIHTLLVLFICFEVHELSVLRNHLQNSKVSFPQMQQIEQFHSPNAAFRTKEMDKYENGQIDQKKSVAAMERPSKQKTPPKSSETNSKKKRVLQRQSEKKGKIGTATNIMMKLVVVLLTFLPTHLMFQVGNSFTEIEANWQPMNEGGYKCYLEKYMPVQLGDNIKVLADLKSNSSDLFVLGQIDIDQCNSTGPNIHCEQTITIKPNAIDKLEHISIEQMSDTSQTGQRDADNGLQQKATASRALSSQTGQRDADNGLQQKGTVSRALSSLTDQRDADNGLQQKATVSQARRSLQQMQPALKLPYGQLSLQGQKLFGEDGKPARLIGISLFWSQYNDEFWNEQSIRQLKCSWHANVIRAPFAVEPNGYIEDPQREMVKLERVIAACDRLGVYLIIDWHLTNDNPYTDQAVQFFSEISRKYGHMKNILYETWNEAMHVPWSTMVQHHTRVINAIRANDPDNLILCGTPSYDMWLGEALVNRLPFDKIMYTIHWYAADTSGTGGNGGDDKLLAQAKDAYSKGMALFCTEWGTGSGSQEKKPLNYGLTERWLDWMNDNEIPSINWSVYADENYPSFPLRTGTTPEQLGNDAMLTPDGLFVKHLLQQWNPQNFCTVPGTNPAPKGQNPPQTLCPPPPSQTPWPPQGQTPPQPQFPPWPPQGQYPPQTRYPTPPSQTHWPPQGQTPPQPQFRPWPPQAQFPPLPPQPQYPPLFQGYQLCPPQTQCPPELQTEIPQLQLTLCERTPLTYTPCILSPADLLKISLYHFTLPLLLFMFM